MQKYLPCPQRNSQNFRVRMQKRKKKGKKFNCLESTKLSEKVIHRPKSRRNGTSQKPHRRKWLMLSGAQRKKERNLCWYTGLGGWGRESNHVCLALSRSEESGGESLASFASSEENKYKENKKEIKSCWNIEKLK